MKTNIIQLKRAYESMISGFWHMGQFYQYCKKFLGELPSQTLVRVGARATPQFPSFP